jgi:hypothetical protein
MFTGVVGAKKNRSYSYGGLKSQGKVTKPVICILKFV